MTEELNFRSSAAKHTMYMIVFYVFTEYHYVADALKGEEVPREVFVKYRKLLMDHNMEFLGRFDPMEVIAELNRRKVINDMDKENIQAEKTTQGNISATHVLLDRVWRHHQNWYEEFLDVLCEKYPHIVKSMDENFHASEYIIMYSFFNNNIKNKLGILRKFLS